MYSKGLSIIFLFFILTNASCQKNKKNRKPRQKCAPEDCILLRHCSSFLEELRFKTNAVRIRIKERKCGTIGLFTKVCCPYTTTNQKLFFPNTCGLQPVVAGTIVNGEETRMGEFPWAVVLGYARKGVPGYVQKCSASIINARYVLTAAHCLDPKRLVNYNISIIRLGDWNIKDIEDCIQTNSPSGIECAPPFIEAKPEKIISHPMYNTFNLKNDIALIRLDRTIDFIKSKGYIHPICIPPSNLNPKSIASGREPYVIGWGQITRVSSNKKSSILLKANVPFGNPKDCMKTYSYIEMNQLCVGGTEKDSCDGDSGSPLFLVGPKGPPFLQIGIVSYGPVHCGINEHPAIYTSVGMHREWIAKSLEKW